MNSNDAFLMLKKSADARDAKIILKKILGINSAIIPDVNLSVIQQWRVWNAARKLRINTPVAKIIGFKEFYGMDFETGRGTLDPRPDSETLIELTIKTFTARKNEPLRILDCGTGTGCLIAALMREFPNATGIGIDISHSAVRCAARNMLRLKMYSRVHIKRRDFTKPIDGQFDIIISNPPYIAINDTRVDVAAKHDPITALYAGKDGLNAYRALAKNTKEAIAPGGILIVEIGIGQDADVKKIFETAGFTFVKSARDLNGITRALLFNRR
jgi:release factor glutamine methyltransferase